MCRMIGMVAVAAADSEESGAAQAAPLPSWQHLVGAPHSLRVQAEVGSVPPGDEAGHDDSWGVGWFDAQGQVSLIRQTGSAADSAYFVFAAETASRSAAGSGPARTLIGHLRKASCGVVSSENAHPVRADFGKRQTLLVAHNGTIRPPLLAGIREDLQAARREEAGSDSDTVALAGWLALRLDRAGSTADLLESVAGALRELLLRAEAIARMPGGDETQAYSALNLLISHPEGLFALRQFSKEPDYYTLLTRPLLPEEGKGWLVASEATDKESGWEPLIPGCLTFFPVTGNRIRSVFVHSR